MLLSNSCCSRISSLWLFEESGVVVLGYFTCIPSHTHANTLVLLFLITVFGAFSIWRFGWWYWIVFCKWKEVLICYYSYTHILYTHHVFLYLCLGLYLLDEVSFFHFFCLFYSLCFVATVWDSWEESWCLAWLLDCTWQLGCGSILLQKDSYSSHVERW